MGAARWSASMGGMSRFLLKLLGRRSWKPSVCGLGVQFKVGAASIGRTSIFCRLRQRPLRSRALLPILPQQRDGPAEEVARGGARYRAPDEGRNRATIGID